MITNPTWQEYKLFKFYHNLVHGYKTYPADNSGTVVGEDRVVIRQGFVALFRKYQRCGHQHPVTQRVHWFLLNQGALCIMWTALWTINCLLGISWKGGKITSRSQLGTMGRMNLYKNTRQIDFTFIYCNEHPYSLWVGLFW